MNIQFIMSLIDHKKLIAKKYDGILLASVLQSAGISVEGLIVIIGIDLILGMFRTAVNLTGDLTACLIFNRFYKVIPKTKTVTNKPKSNKE